MKVPHTPLADLTSLTGKTVLVTGAAMGIGRAIAERYAEAGAQVLIVDIDPSASQTAKEISDRYKVTAIPYAVDLSDIDALQSFWNDLDTPPDILVNNAGVFWPTNLMKLTPERYGKMMDINTRAVLFMCKYFVEKRGLKNPGVIVNISSLEGVRGMTPHMPVYGASKAAVLAIGRDFTQDYAKHGWRLNTILPGGVTTPGGTKLALAAFKKLDFSMLLIGMKFNSRLPTKKLGKPDDIARVALFLGLPMSSYMYGSEVVVDGGFLAV